MRVFLFLSSDRLFKPWLLRSILAGNGFDVVGVAEVANRRRPFPSWRKKWSFLKKQLGFWGAIPSMAIATRSFRLFLKDILPGPGYSLESVCREFGVPYSFVQDVDAPDFLRDLKKLELDVLVSSQHQIFKEPLLAVPSIACINCHPAKLPKYRGIKPIFWAMYHGEEEIGVTVHTMTPDIDVGRKISQRSFVNHPGSSLLQNYEKAFVLEAELILESLAALANRPIESFPFLPANSTYFKWPPRDDIKKFRDRGGKMI